MSVERLVPGTKEWDAFLPDHFARYLFAKEYCKGLRVLDAGTGVGYGAAILKSYGAATVRAIDIDAKTIETARRLYGALGIDYLVDDCERLSQVDGQYDLICNFENIEHLQHPDRFLEASTKKLAPGGLLICSSPDRSGTPPFQNGKPNNPFHVNEWYFDEFRDLLGRYYQDVEILSQVKLKSYENGKSAFASVTYNLAAVAKNSLLLRFKQALRVLLGKPPYLQPVDSTFIDSFLNYPIFPRVTADIIGFPWCHVALCRSPKA